MNENELVIKTYRKDYGFGRIVLRTIDGSMYLGEDRDAAAEFVKDFIEKQLSERR